MKVKETHLNLSIRPLALFLLAIFLLPAVLAISTPLDDYVAQVDDAYCWHIHSSSKEENYTFYTIELSSQKWRNSSEVDKPLWIHWLTVVVPDIVEGNLALLKVGNGINGEPSPTLQSQSNLIAFALKSQTVVAEIRLIPNQSLKFTDESNPRHLINGRFEDALITYSWDKFLLTGDPTWSIRLPMTKAVVRAMDALQTFQTLNLSNIPSIQGFVVMGLSKRGWTTWTTAAVDPRVKGIVPIVIDALNFKQSFENHFSAYGQWSPAVRDYLDINLPKRWDSARFKELMCIEEPYEYRNRYVMPKYIINAASDEFFLPDSSQLYFHELPGAKGLRYIANVSHAVKDDDYQESLLAFYKTVLLDLPMPNLDWSVDEDGFLNISTSSPALKATLWQASNPIARDFRLSTNGPLWKSQPLTIGQSAYQIHLDCPQNGWCGFFVEVVLDNGVGDPLTLTTDIYILPNLFSYPKPES